MKKLSKKGKYSKLTRHNKSGGVLMTARTNRRKRMYRNAGLNNRMGKRRGGR